MLKVLFLINSLGQGGAEKVLVNLVNNMDKTKFDITVIALFGGGVNEQFLDKTIHFKSLFSKMLPGNSKIMKLFSPKQLHKLLIKDRYDIEISYLEGPTARIISGCSDKFTKLVSWIHVEQHDLESASSSFRNSAEAIKCYNRFDRIVCVSEYVKKDFMSIFNLKNACIVLYNTVESKIIKEQSEYEAEEIIKDDALKLIAVGTLKKSKGYERLLRIIYRLKNEGYRVHLYILGIGPMQKKIEEYIVETKLENNVTLLGYKINPYKYVKKCDLFVCASYTEGFSTATTESLIVGTPVCTVEVSGMKEMLGNNNEYGIVTENSEDGLYLGIKTFLEQPQLLSDYKNRAQKRGNIFNTKNTVNSVEEMLESL